MRQRTARPPVPAARGPEVKTYPGTTLRPKVGDIVQYTPPGSSGWEPSHVTGVCLHTTEDADFDLDAAIASPDRFPPCRPEVQVSSAWVPLQCCTLIRCGVAPKEAPPPQVRTRVRVAAPPPASHPPEPSPLFAEWRGYRDTLPEDSILMMRLGDFFEFFYDDAHRAKEVLGIALTKRNGVPMSGIPHHSAAGYVERLRTEGLTVYVADYPEGYVHFAGAIRGGVASQRTLTLYA